MVAAVAPLRATLARWSAPGFSLWLVPLVVAAAGAVALHRAGDDVALLRGLVFVGAPLLLLAGLHARLGDYLHADARRWLLPRPVPPNEHWHSARPTHRRGLWFSLGLGTAAVTVGPLSASIDMGTRVGLILDWAWVWLLAALLEPLVPALGAALGRRFDEDRREHRLQRSLGGGWTIPEAVIHLYAPAAVLGLATALAMPGQLWLDRTLDGVASPVGLAVGSGLALPLAVVARWFSPRLYQRGLFGAVPWVHEAMRTLAGPPVPEAVPGWLLWGRDPVRHLWLRQFWRMTPVPGLRLWAMILVAAWMAAAAPPSLSIAALGLTVVAAWLVPAGRLARLLAIRRRLLSTLPLAAADRSGRCWTAWATVVALPVVAAAAVGLAWSVRA